MNLFDLIFTGKKNSKTSVRSLVKRSTTRTDVLDGIKILYKKHPFSKNIRISVKPDGRVLVTMPKNASFLRAKEFVLKNKDWIKERVSKSTPKTRENEAVIEERRKLAHKILPKRLDELARKYGFKYAKVFVKNQRTVWGSCSYRNNINLNLNLVALDSEFIDYVLLHELTHTVHKNHQKAFYDLLTKNMPNALDVQKRLKKIKISALK
ncbi:MAG: DUF45 domain-containing protein [Candidatus Gastranaerophilales bacterium]|nr:DUF45 domain-containing protein [Candidatus Gastranaerophilales bacterium]